VPSLDFQRTIAASQEEVFDLCRSVDFHVEAARTIKARAIGHRTTGLATLDDQTTYSAAFFGMRFRLTTRITSFEQPRYFKEELVKGLFKKFSHHYRVSETNEGTLLEDCFTFVSPLGWVGRLWDKFVLERVMIRVQNERLDAIKRKAEAGGLS